MSNTELISLIAMLLCAGGVSSYLVQVIKREAWGPRVRWILSLVLSGAVGLATSWLAGDVLGLVASWGSLTAADVFAFMAATYASAAGFYALWLGPRSRAA